MGKGTFHAETVNQGSFNLIVSVRHKADSTRLNEWREAFALASRVLYNATSRQHWLNTIYVCNDSTGGDLADAYLLQMDATSSPGVNPPGLGENNKHQVLGADERFKPYVIIHELGHYIYGLGEEYNYVGQPQCTGNDTTQACIMEFDFMHGARFGVTGGGGAEQLGTVSQFCYQGNHTNNNGQHVEHAESCWETIKTEYPGLEVPTVQPVTTSGAPPPINWILLQQEQRFVLVLDRSISMGSNNKLTAAKRGANYWVDFAEEKDKIAVVSYADTANVVYPLTEITSGMNRDPIQNAIDTIMVEGSDSIVVGLRGGLNQIRGNDPNNRAASQVIVLVTDGFGVAPDATVLSTVLKDLRDFGVRVYTIGIGPYINSSLLQQIATDTGGEFYPIAPNPDIEAQAQALRDTLITAQGIAHDNGEIVLTIPGSTNPGVQREQVQIEEGCQMATFTLSWRNAEDLLFLELLSPSGESYSLDSSPKDARVVYSERPYMGFQVMKPAAGLWTLIVKPDHVEKIAYYKLFVFSRNTRLYGRLVTPSTMCNPGDPITLRFLGYFDRPITGLDVTGTVTMPGGKTVPLVFNTAPEDGIYETTFTQTRQRGMYSFSVKVNGDKNSVFYARSHWPSESNQGDPIPSFWREYSRTVAVSEEPVQTVEVEPRSSYPGGKFQVTIKGKHTHFKQGSTSIDFGENIRASEINIIDAETALVTLYVDKEATLGPRNITVTTEDFKETVEAEEGFQVVLRKRVFSEKWIIRLLVFIIIVLIILLLIMAMLLVRGR